MTTLQTNAATVTPTRWLALAALVVLSLATQASPFGTIGGPADSLLRISSTGSECSIPSGMMCVESINNLQYDDYSQIATAELFGSGSILHSAGVLLARFDTSPAGIGFQAAGSLNVHARDRFTVAGPDPGATVQITARLRVRGDLFAAGSPAEASATVEALLSRSPDGWDSTNGGMGLSTGDAGLFRRRFLPGDPFLTSPTPMPIEIEAVDTFDVVAGEVFQLVYRMHLLGNVRGDPTSQLLMDFGNSAELSFELPQGYAIESELGYSFTAVPLPAALWTLLSALAVLLVREGRTNSSS